MVGARPQVWVKNKACLSFQLDAAVSIFNFFVRLYNCVGKTREWSYKLFGSMMSLTSRYDNTVYFYSLGMIFKSYSDQNSFYDWWLSGFLLLGIEVLFFPQVLIAFGKRLQEMTKIVMKAFAKSKSSIHCFFRTYPRAKAHNKAKGKKRETHPLLSIYSLSPIFCLVTSNEHVVPREY